jgi:hypothetical protein
LDERQDSPTAAPRQSAAAAGAGRGDGIGSTRGPIFPDLDVD